MGELRALKDAPAWIKKHYQVRDYVKADFPHLRYLCGNCFFDIDDEREMQG